MNAWMLHWWWMQGWTTVGFDSTINLLHHYIRAPPYCFLPTTMRPPKQSYNLISHPSARCTLRYAIGNLPQRTIFTAGALLAFHHACGAVLALAVLWHGTQVRHHGAAALALRAGQGVRHLSCKGGLWPWCGHYMSLPNDFNDDGESSVLKWWTIMNWSSIITHQNYEIREMSDDNNDDSGDNKNNDKLSGEW